MIIALFQGIMIWVVYHPVGYKYIFYWHCSQQSLFCDPRLNANAGRCEPLDTQASIIPPLYLWAESPRLLNIAVGGFPRHRRTAGSNASLPNGSYESQDMYISNHTYVPRGEIFPVSPAQETPNQPSWVQWASSPKSGQTWEQDEGQAGDSGCCGSTRCSVMQDPRVLLLVTNFAIFSVKCAHVYSWGGGGGRSS